MEGKLRKKLADVAHKLYNDGLTYGTSGNISARIPHSNKCLIKPSGFSFGDVNHEDFLLVDINTGDAVWGEHSPSIETPFHIRLYQQRGVAGGIVHIHSKYCVILSIIAKKFVPMGMEIYNAPSLAKGVEIIKFAAPGSEMLADKVCMAMKEKYACLLPHHGSVTIGKNIEEAEMVARTLETLARLQYHVMLFGEPKPLPDKILEQLEGMVDENTA
ncbi:MAG: class II aldolase/adducin family protein [Candidatus Bathyarchaeia archaeon]